MNLKKNGLSICLIAFLLIIAGASAIAQEAVFWIDVKDGNTPDLTTRMYFGTAPGATYATADTLTLSGLGTIREQESPPPNPDGSFILWKSIPGRVNTWGTGFMIYDFRSFPTNATRKDTFKLGFASANTSANFVLKWDPTELNPIALPKVDSIKLAITGMPVTNMLTTDSVVIEAAGDNGVVAATIYKWSILTGVRSDDNTIPASFALHSNYPNPFNPSTKISYDVQSASFVDISIYNVLGQKVATLIADDHAPGTGYSVEWNGLNSQSKAVASGVYFARMTARSNGVEEFSALQKLLLVK